MWGITEMSLLHPDMCCNGAERQDKQEIEAVIYQIVGSCSWFGVLGVPSNSATEKVFGGHWQSQSSYTGAMWKRKTPTVLSVVASDCLCEFSMTGPEILLPSYPAASSQHCNSFGGKMLLG